MWIETFLHIRLVIAGQNSSLLASIDDTQLVDEIRGLDVLLQLRGVAVFQQGTAAHAFSTDELLSPTATRSLVARYVRLPGPRPAVSKEAARSLALLTEREREVLQLVGRGLSNQQIAETFFISPHTAKTHVNRIMTKIHAHDRAQLVILAYESGLLIPGE